MRPIWQGSISFGLVTIPIKIYTALNHRAIKFRLVHTKDKSPVQYRKFCAKENKEIELKEISKAIEITKGKFYVINKEELEKLKPVKSDVIDIIEFVDSNLIDSIYYNSPYYITPAKNKDKAYFLFKKVLQDTGKTAVGKIIIREKEYACILTSYKSGILMFTLNYEYEIKNITELQELKEIPQLRTAETNLATQLIQQLTEDEFNISEFKDNYEKQLKDLIKKKEKGETIELPKKVKTKKEENLISALRASLK